MNGNDAAKRPKCKSNDPPLTHLLLSGGTARSAALNRRNRFLWIGVMATAAAWGCFQGMEVVPLYSAPSEALFYGGYALVGLALFMLFKGFREPNP